MREKIFPVAKQLNDENNVLAANFAQRRSGFVGVATPFEGLLASIYLANIFKGFQRILSDSVWDFALFDTLSPSFSDGSKLEKFYRSRKVEGLLVIAPRTDDTFPSTLADLRISLAVGEMVALSSVSCVVCDDGQGIELACDHFFSLGHRRIALRRGTAGSHEGAAAGGLPQTLPRQGVAPARRVYLRRRVHVGIRPACGPGTPVG